MSGKLKELNESTDANHGITTNEQIPINRELFKIAS